MQTVLNNQQAIIERLLNAFISTDRISANHSLGDSTNNNVPEPQVTAQPDTFVPPPYIPISPSFYDPQINTSTLGKDLKHVREEISKNDNTLTHNAFDTLVRVYAYLAYIFHPKIKTSK